MKWLRGIQALYVFLALSLAVSLSLSLCPYLPALFLSLSLVSPLFFLSLSILFLFHLSLSHPVSLFFLFFFLRGFLFILSLFRSLHILSHSGYLSISFALYRFDTIRQYVRVINFCMHVMVH